MQIKKKIIFFLNLAVIKILLFPTILFSSGLGQLTSLSWQQNELERKITDRVERSVNAIINSKDFIVNVDIQVTLPETPDFHISDLEHELLEEIQAEGEDGPVDPFEGLESDSMIRFTNERPDENADGFIAFNKLGILAPLVDDFNDFRPDGKIVFTMDQAGENAEAAQEGPSYFEQFWKLNNAMDIFANLRSVDIKVTLNENLNQVSRDAIERVLNSLDFNLGAITPTLSIDYLPLDELRVDQRPFLVRLFDFFEKYATLIAIVLASLILATAAYLIFREYKKWKKVGMIKIQPLICLVISIISSKIKKMINQIPQHWPEGMATMD